MTIEPEDEVQAAIRVGKTSTGDTEPRVLTWPITVFPDDMPDPQPVKVLWRET